MAKQLLPVIHITTGVVLLPVGLFFLPLPTPIGLPLLVISLGLLAPYLPPVQRFVRYLRRRFPVVDRTMLKFKHKCPPVLRKAIEWTNPHLHPNDPAQPAE